MGMEDIFVGETHTDSAEVLSNPSTWTSADLSHQLTIGRDAMEPLGVEERLQATLQALIHLDKWIKFCVVGIALVYLETMRRDDTASSISSRSYYQGNWWCPMWTIWARTIDTHQKNAGSACAFWAGWNVDVQVVKPCSSVGWLMHLSSVATRGYGIMNHNLDQYCQWRGGLVLVFNRY